MSPDHAIINIIGKQALLIPNGPGISAIYNAENRLCFHTNKCIIYNILKVLSNPQNWWNHGKWLLPLNNTIILVSSITTIK